VVEPVETLNEPPVVELVETLNEPPVVELVETPFIASSGVL
jgi:hypothetical protein